LQDFLQQCSFSKSDAQLKGQDDHGYQSCSGAHQKQVIWAQAEPTTIRKKHPRSPLRINRVQVLA
jgi:hypothetical protein